MDKGCRRLVDFQKRPLVKVIGNVQQPAHLGIPVLEERAQLLDVLRTRADKDLVLGGRAGEDDVEGVFQRVADGQASRTQPGLHRWRGHQIVQVCVSCDGRNGDDDAHDGDARGPRVVGPLEQGSTTHGLRTVCTNDKVGAQLLLAARESDDAVGEVGCLAVDRHCETHVGTPGDGFVVQDLAQIRAMDDQVRQAILVLGVGIQVHLPEQLSIAIRSQHDGLWPGRPVADAPQDAGISQDAAGIDRELDASSNLWFMSATIVLFMIMLAGKRKYLSQFDIALENRHPVAGFSQQDGRGEAHQACADHHDVEVEGEVSHDISYQMGVGVCCGCGGGCGVESLAPHAAWTRCVPRH